MISEEMFELYKQIYDLKLEKNCAWILCGILLAVLLVIILNYLISSFTGGEK